MLYLVGTGLKPEHLTLEAVEILKKCDKVFLDMYTSVFSEGKIVEIETIIGKKIFSLSRSKLEEDSAEIFVLAKKNDVAVLVIGNPLTATTHIQLFLEAHHQKIKTQIVAGISVTNFLAKTGLDEYRFGRICTIAEHKTNFEPDSFYNFIEQNQKNGLHTLCLLDTGDGKKFQSAIEAIEILEKIEDKKVNKLLQKSIFVVLAAAGAQNEQIVQGGIEKIKRTKIDVFPQSLIVCGKLTEKENETLGELYG